MLIMDCDDDKIDDLLPKKATIGKRRRSKLKSKKVVSQKETPTKIIPAVHGFKDSDPFSNPKEFVAFYRSIVHSFAEGKVEFPSHGADRQYASVIMDELLDIGRGEDLEFLREWIKYYAQFKLKKGDFEKFNKTSLRSFSVTLDEYKQKHIDIK